MSKENVELIRRGYADPDPLAGLAANASDSVEFDLTALYPEQPVLRGIDAIRRFQQEESVFGKSLRFVPERYFDIDDERVLVFVHAQATGEGSGVPVEARVAHEFTIRAGLIVRFKVFRDREEALEAAGLSE